MTDEETMKIQCMRFWFARPSSLHDDPNELIKWANGLPKVYRNRAPEVISNEEMLLDLYDELIAREQQQGQS
jgi:hypothetical protein